MEEVHGRRGRNSLRRRLCILTEELGEDDEAHTHHAASARHATPDDMVIRCLAIPAVPWSQCYRSIASPLRLSHLGELREYFCPRPDRVAATGRWTLSDLRDASLRMGAIIRFSARTGCMFSNFRDASLNLGAIIRFSEQFLHVYLGKFFHALPIIP